MLKIYLSHGDLHSNLWKSDLHFRPDARYVTIVFVPRVTRLNYSKMADVCRIQRFDLLFYSF